MWRTLGETAIGKSGKQGRGRENGGVKKKEEEERWFEKQEGRSDGYFSPFRAVCFGGSLPFQLVYLTFV